MRKNEETIDRETKKMNRKVIGLKSHREERYRRDLGREQDRLGGEETQVWAHW